MIFIKRLLLVVVTVVLTFLLFSFSSPSFLLPVNGKITSDFGNRINPITNKKEFHNAVDIAAEISTPVLAPADCVVTEVANDTIYGIFVKVKSEEYQFRFCHLSETSLKKDDILKAGDEIGKVGNTGWTTGAHLHLEVIKNEEFVNPKKVFDFK